MAAQIAGVLEQSLQQKIVDSKTLVVGAGGIGCEVLKNLVMCGFSDIEIVSIIFISNSISAVPIIHNKYSSFADRFGYD